VHTATLTPPSNNTFVPVAGLLFFAIASGFLMSLIPLSLTSFSISESLAPWLATIFYLGLLIGATGIESVISKIGHRKAFICFLSLLILTIVTMILFHSSAIWLLSRFVAGISVAGIFVVVESWLLMGGSKSQRAKRLGLYMTALYGGSAFGQLAIGYIGITGNTPFLCVILLLMIALLPPLLIKSGQPSKQKNHKMHLSELKNLSQPGLLGCLVSGLLLGPIYGLLPLYTSGRVENAEQIGLLMAVIIVGGMVVQPIVSYLSPRMSKSLLMAFFCLFAILSVIGILTTSSVMVLLFSYFILGACSFALYPIAITLACDSLPSEKIVSATEVMLLSYSAGSVLGPLLALSFHNYEHGLILYIGLCLITTCIYMLYKSIPKAPEGNCPLV
jgi:UMF2 family putative MFS family transporter